MTVMKKNKVLSCSTPEYQGYSPSRDSDSDAASPVPFLCTQDGAEGETDVIWNYYTPKSDYTNSRIKNSTPLSTREKRQIKPKRIQRVLPKRKAAKASHKNKEFIQELHELNQNVYNLIEKNVRSVTEKDQLGSEEDIFIDSQECSPKSVLKSNHQCLRKNLLSSKFKVESEAALESDDSMNECLLKASQVVEDTISTSQSSVPKNICSESATPKYDLKPGINFEINNDSMDAILNSIKIDTPISNSKRFNTTDLNNDSFDNLVGNLNDSALEKLTQMPLKTNTTDNRFTTNNSEATSWTVAEVTVYDGSPSSNTVFNRYSSMPESPSVTKGNKPSTSGMTFGRFNTMPYKNEGKFSGDSQIRCTREEIERKRQQAKEKLLAKRQLPFTSQTSIEPKQTTNCKQNAGTNKFQFKVASSNLNKPSSISVNINVHDKSNDIPIKSNVNSNNLNTTNQKLLIEKKRQEAVMKLRSRQSQKMT